MDLTEYFSKFTGKTDKGTGHNYIQKYYNDLFTPIKDNDITLLEIGIADGKSIKLWRNFFTKATLYAIDKVERVEGIIDKINKEMHNTTAFLMDAYTIDALNQFKDESFDYIIDDGPHTHPSHLFVVQHYISKLKRGGRLIIEDVGWLDTSRVYDKFTNVVSLNKNLSMHSIDLRDQQKPNNVIIEVRKN